MNESSLNYFSSLRNGENYQNALGHRSSDSEEMVKKRGREGWGCSNYTLHRKYFFILISNGNWCSQRVNSCKNITFFKTSSFDDFELALEIKKLFSSYDGKPFWCVGVSSEFKCQGVIQYRNLRDKWNIFMSTPSSILLASESLFHLHHSSRIKPRNSPVRNPTELHCTTPESFRDLSFFFFSFSRGKMQR